MQIDSQPGAEVRVPTMQEIDDGWTWPPERALTRRPSWDMDRPAQSQPGATLADWPVPREDTRMNLNTATLDQLCALPGIGTRKAQAIISYREQHGHLQAVRDLATLQGFGPVLIRRLDTLCRL